MDVKLIKANKLDTLGQLMDKAVEQLKVKEKKENIRFRAYKPSTDTKLDTYTGKEQLSLQDLNIGHFKVLCIEVKKDEDKFEEYVANSTYIRVCLWKKGLATLNENLLETDKININLTTTILELQVLVSTKYNIPEDKLIILKRHQAHGQSCAEYLNVDANYSLTLDTMDIFEGSILFVEEKT